jgi:hypothetical protein
MRTGYLQCISALAAYLLLPLPLPLQLLINAI